MDLRYALFPITSNIGTAKLLDVTLRDGGFQTNFNWTIDEISTITQSVLSAGADLVELGYIGGVPGDHNVNKGGIGANLTPSMISKIYDNIFCSNVQNNLPKNSLVAMIHPSSITHSLPFDKYKDAGLSMLRFIYHQTWHEKLVLLHNEAKSKGFVTSINLALISRYQPKEIQKIITDICILNPDIIYIADTCSALLPHDVSNKIHLVNSSNFNNLPLGFHAHDFLSLALANSIEAEAAGTSYIDSSILGIGRGAGNLRTEFWLSLKTSRTCSKNNLEPLKIATSIVLNKFGESLFLPDFLSIVSASANLTPPQEEIIREISSNGDEFKVGNKILNSMDKHKLTDILTKGLYI